jgi:hypothetical protein
VSARLQKVFRSIVEPHLEEAIFAVFGVRLDGADRLDHGRVEITKPGEKSTWSVKLHLSSNMAGLTSSMRPALHPFSSSR